MKSFAKTLKLLLVFLITFPYLGFAQSDEELKNIIASVNKQRIVTTISTLCSSGSRVVGYPGNKAAARYIEKEFRSIGLQNVHSEEFQLVAPIDKGAEIFLPSEGKKLALYCLWPNFVRTPTVPPEGISGNLIYVKQGRWSDFNGKQVENSIVLMDFESGTNFLNARLLGAKAVIFLPTKNILRAEAERKFLRLPVNIPRFWIPPQDGELLLTLLQKRKSVPVNLKAKMDWEKVVTRNIFGFIEGNDPKYKDQIIIVEAYYDAMSVVPALATGADQASGIAALLEIARTFSKRVHPRRSIMFMAASGHFMALAGVDDFVQKHARKKRIFRQRIKTPINFHLFLGLDLSSHNSQLGTFYTGAFYNPTLSLNISDEYYRFRYFVPFGKRMATYAKSFSQLANENVDDVFINTISPTKGRSWRNYFSGTLFAFDAEIVTHCGNPGLALITLNDVRTAWDTPIDVIENVNFENLTKQTRFLAYLLARAANDPEFRSRGDIELKDDGKSVKGRFLEFHPRRGFMPKDPVKNAIAVVRSPLKVYVGVRGDNFAISDENGEFYMTTVRPGNPGLEGYGIDPTTGELIYAPDLGWEDDFPLDVPLTWDENRITIVLFRSKPVDVFELVDPRYLNVLDMGEILSARGFPLRSYWTSIWEKQSREPNNVEPCATIFVEPKTPFKALFFTSLFSKRFLLLNSTPENYEGIGYTPEKGAILNTPLHVAQDMNILDEARLKNFKKYGIRNQRVEELHQSASKALEEAKKAKKSRKYDLYIKKVRKALGLEARAYPDVQGTANDTIKGVVFYLALLLPFSYFAERLLFGFVEIKKRLITVALIFIVIFFILRFVHPAFEISSSPYIILIAFVTAVLAIYVLAMLISKFNAQMRRLRSKTTAIHGVDVGRITASATAFSLGVSFMKKRRMRTFLTTLTLVLLTFIVLSFSSVNTYLKFYQIPYKNKPSYQGALIRDPNWMPLQETVLDYVRSAFADQAIVNPRAWFSSRLWGEKDFFEIASYKGKRSYTTGILGLTAQEPLVTGLDKFLLPGGRWFRQGEKYSCILPAYMAHLLGIEPQDVGKATIKIFGDSFLVVGILDSEKFNKFRDLDNEPLTPVDYSIIPQQLIGRQTDVETFQRKSVQATIPSYKHLGVDGVLILPYEYIRGINGTIHSIALKFHRSDFIGLIEEFITRVTRVVFVGIGEQVVAYSAATQTSLAGLGNLFIPILIVALIMLNTMIGAVQERVREIGVYSSVGLAPTHIAFLFLAEACVYAILGGIIGYVLGQAVSKIVTTFNLLSGLTLNYSSLSVVFSTLLVMAVVLLSTLYPARKAAQMAVPDVTRRWVFPEPKGDYLDFDFPFAVSGQEILGLYVFLLDYFSGFEEESVGNFYTKGIKLSQIDTEQGKGYRMFMKMWLAPYDLGLSQEVELLAIPSGEYNVFTIRLKIHLTSGDMASWKRINRRFLKDVRKQFLIWRTVAVTEKDKYTERGNQMLKLEKGD